MGFIVASQYNTGYAAALNRNLATRVAMPDMLVRLYDLPDASAAYQRVQEAGVMVRRADPWDRERYRRFVEEAFGTLWAVEADLAYHHSPITAFLAEKEQRVVGVAAYECTRRGFFGPTGVEQRQRRRGMR